MPLWCRGSGSTKQGSEAQRFNWDHSLHKWSSWEFALDLPAYLMSLTNCSLLLFHAVWVFCCCETDYYKASSLNLTVTGSQLCRSTLHGWALHSGWNLDVGWTCSHPELRDLFQVQKSDPCSCGTQNLGFLLAISWRLPSAVPCHVALP